MMRRRRRPALAALGVALLTPPAVAATLATLEPRAFGYQLGDTVERRLIVELPSSLPDAALPRPGRRGGVELRSVGVERQAVAAGVRHEIRLQYQVFVAPPETRALTLPALELAPAADQPVAVPEFRIYVSPLVPTNFATDAALGTMRPDAPRRPIATAATQTRLALCAATALLLALVLAWRQFGDLWLARRRGPFAAAWHELRRLDAKAPQAGRFALRRLHRAFDAYAGATLFAESVDAFLARHPEFAGQRAAILAFFAASRRAFFSPAGDSGDLAPLLALCAACRAIERARR